MVRTFGEEYMRIFFVYIFFGKIPEFDSACLIMIVALLPTVKIQPVRC